MHKLIVAGALLAAVVGCRHNRDFTYDTYEYDEPVGAYDPNMMIDPACYENVKTSELGTEMRGRAKSVDWQYGSIEEGMTYVGGTILVDKVLRNDADNLFDVTIRLRNTDANPSKVEWKIALYSSDGTRIAGLTDWTGDKEVWHNCSIDARGFASVTNGARVKGATIFRLQVRRSGANDEGNPEKGKDRSFDDIRKDFGDMK